MIELATKYGRYGYRRITALLQREGLKVNNKRVELLCRANKKIRGNSKIRNRLSRARPVIKFSSFLPKKLILVILGIFILLTLTLTVAPVYTEHGLALAQGVIPQTLVWWLAESLGFIAVAWFTWWVYTSTYHPGEAEPESVVTTTDAPLLKRGTQLKVLTWNVQFFASNCNNHFFFDGGTDTWPQKETLIETANQVAAIIRAEDPDIIILQELDEGAARSYFQDQLQHLLGLLPEDYVSHASSFYWQVDFVPCEEINGSVGMKMTVISKYRVKQATRYALPSDTTDNLIVRQFKVKHAILAVSMPIDGGGNFNVLNTHLCAFSQGTDTIERQVAMVGRVFEQTEASGEPVLLAGDFNLIPSDEAYKRLESRGKKYFNPKGTELAPLLNRYRSIPSLEETNSENYARWHTHFTSLSQDEFPDKTLDYIFVSQNLVIGDHYVRVSDTRAISDHLPVVAYVTLP